MNWQPIETAPKEHDKLLFLGWAGEAVDIGGWDTDPRAETPRPFWNWNDGRGREYMRRDPPTHWMALPDPPPVQGVCIICGGPTPLTGSNDDILACEECEQHTPRPDQKHASNHKL